MTSLFFPLQVTRGIAGVFLKPLRGSEELLVEDTGTKTALSLLDGMMNGANSNHGACDINASKISTADRDRILAHLYISIYGSKVESTLICENCEAPFDLDFSMIDLLNHYKFEEAFVSGDGTFQIDSGGSFRLPTGEDELMLTGVSPKEAEDLLIARCLVSGEAGNDRDGIQRKMSEIAPVLNVEMQANCPECSHAQEVRFDIQSFFLLKIKQERTQLIREIHTIALNYRWAHDTILHLPRDLRKQYVSYIEFEG